MSEGIEKPRLLQPVPSKPLAAGDVVFFKRARGGLSARDRFAEFQGHGFGILLGHVPSDAPVPPLLLVLRQMGSFGFISFDDVIQLMGKEIGDQLALKFAEKYYGKEVIVTGLSPDEARSAAVLDIEGGESL